MRHLTVQDVLWINLTLSKQVNGYRYADLEEATYYQYAYGQSRSLTALATRFFSGFVRKAPIDGGVEATAFVALVAFLRLNDADLNVRDGEAAAWIDRALDDPHAIESTIIAKHAHEHGHNPPVRAVILDVIRDYPSVVRTPVA